MIDPFDAELISLADAAKVLPRVRQGRPVHVATLWRWARYGLQGVRLSTIKIGGTVCTSPALLRTFFSEVAKASNLRSETPQRNPSDDVEDRVESELQQRFKL